MEVWDRSETVDPEVRAYVHSLVNAVGGQSTLDDRYALGDDALAVLNDLLRWLRLYDEKTNRYDVKRCLAEANLVKGDLLEILALWPEREQENRVKSKLALACLQLLVPLTWPLGMEEDKTTVNHLRHTPYLQLAQVGYKRAILHYEDANILRTVVRVGLPAMAVGRRERTRRDEGIIKMVLYFLRNVAMIVQPQELPSQGDENEISRSATVEAFHEQDVFSLLLTVGSGASDEFQEQDVIVLETLFHLLKGVDPKKLFMQKEQVSTEETNELQNLINKEKAMLSNYNKHAPTRHNRFGTMLWVKRDAHKVSTVTGQGSLTNESNTLLHMDSSKKWDKPKYRGKLVQEFSENTDFGMRVELDEKARQHLRAFVEDFLDTSFNPLFASLRKAIEREAERVGLPHRRQYFYLISWFLAAEASRRDSVRSSSGWHADRPTQTNAADNTYAYIAAVLDQETFVLLNRQMQKAFDEKGWQDLQTTLLAFTQILLTVQSMAASEDEEDQEIAENIQNRIFYEESTQDRIVQILRGYSHQGLAYLDAVTECAHVFIRMLEQYSKQNVDLQIRSKRRARKRETKTNPPSVPLQPGEEQDVNEFNEAEDTAEAYRAVSERKFDFARFSAKFCTQACVNTFISLLHFYADLTPAQLKRCHRYLYRLAFKHELVVLLFRVDILALLQKMMKGPGGLDQAAEGYGEWQTLVQQIFRRCIKWVEREQEMGGEGWREVAVTEMLFSKIPGSLFYLQNGFERVVEKRAPRAPAELEVKGSVDDDKRVGVVVSVLLEQGKGDAIEWLKKELRGAAETRQAWMDEREARRVVEEEDESSGYDPPIALINPDNEERKQALFKDKYLRLLLTTAGCERLGSTDDVDASWIVPSAVHPDQLNDILEQIRKTEFDPPTFDDGKTAQDLIRNKSSARRTTTVHSDSSDSGSDREVDNPLFPPNLPEKRKASDDAERAKKKRRLTPRNQGELTEEQAKARQEEKKRRERERNSKIKSSLFVTASDDESDAEADAEFFSLEAERRERMKGFIRGQLAKEREAGVEGGKGKGRKRKSRVEVGGKRKKKVVDVDSDMEEELALGDDVDSPVDVDLLRDDDFLSEASDEAQQSDHEVLSEEEGQGEGRGDEDAETSSTSPPVGRKSLEERPLAELSGNNVFGKATSAGADVDEDGDEDEEPIAKPAARRSIRAGFVIHDSDSE